MVRFDEHARPVEHGWPDRRIAALAAGQRAQITHQQLRQLGVGRSAIGRAQRRRRLHPVHRGVYALVAPAARPPLATEQAAILACGPRALISHASAAALWGLTPPPRGPVHVTIIGGRTGRNRAGIRVHQTAVLDRRDVRRHQRLPVTAPARTLLDVAPALSGRELKRAVDEALARHVTSRTAIRDMLRRHPGRPGAPRLRALTADVRPSTVTRSDAEERLLALVRRAGLPMPECNATLGGYRPDLLWRDQRVIVELDGYPFHRGRSSFEGDRRRDNELRGAGFQTIRVTRRQVDEEPERVLVWLATALARGTR